MSETAPEETTEEAKWPNQEPPLDGVVPVDEVPQDPDFLDDDDDLEMED